MSDAQQTEPNEPTDENIMKFIFGDEVSSAHARAAVRGPAASAYREVIMPINGTLWARPSVPLRARALMNLAILGTLNRPHEFYTRILGLLRGGISVEEIQEVILHLGYYTGNPSGVEATVSLHEAMTNLDERGIPYRMTPAPWVV
jgi:alkylhydroperoxidase/carboxymuconolactone decarboxylase family protein YurZ